MKVIFEYNSDKDGKKVTKTLSLDAVPSRGDYVYMERSRQLKRVEWYCEDETDPHVIVQLY